MEFISTFSTKHCVHLSLIALRTSFLIFLFYELDALGYLGTPIFTPTISPSYLACLYFAWHNPPKKYKLPVQFPLLRFWVNISGVAVVVVQIN